MSEIERIRVTYSGIFDKLDRYTPDQRAEVLWAVNNEWCPGCGKDLGECLDHMDDGRCCGEDPVPVTAMQCPKCEGIAMSTVRAARPTTEESRDDE